MASVASARPVCERSKAVIKALEAKLNLKCDHIAERDLRKIAALYIGPTSPMLLKSDDLIGLTMLKNLSLKATGSASSIPDGFWTPVSNVLETLSLTLATKTFPSNTLEGLSQLKSLELTLPEAVELNGGNFADLSSLKELTIRTMRVETLPVDLLDGLRKLKTLTFAQSDVENLPKGLLSPVPDLEVFQIWSRIDGQHTLTSIDSQFFAGLKYLRSVFVSQHRLLTIPADLFYGLDNLENIHIGNGPLITLSYDQFRGLKKLRILNLSFNDIRSFKISWLMDSAKSLEYLSLFRLPLDTELDINKIKAFKKLKYLGLVDINLTHIPEGSFSSLKHLESLSLSGNAISVLPDDFLAQSRKVKMVDLGRNPISRIQNSTLFSKLPSLEFLSLPEELWDEDFEKIVEALPSTVRTSRY